MPETVIFRIACPATLIWIKIRDLEWTDPCQPKDDTPAGGDRLQVFRAAERKECKGLLMDRKVESGPAKPAVPESAVAVMAFVETLPWPAIAVDLRGRILCVNAAMRKQRRLDDGDCNGLLRERFPEYHAALRGSPPWLAAQEAEVSRNDETGCVHEHVVVRPLPGGTCLLVEDVTRLRQLQATDAQTARLASLGFMLAGACHELSNPLGAIYSMVQILRMGPMTGPVEVEKCLANIAHNVKRLLEISRRLVGFSRVDDEPRRAFPVDESVDEALLLLQQARQLDEIELVREPDAGAVVMGNPGQLQEIFYNVLLNAVQAMEGCGRLRIRTSRPSPDDIEVAVHDSGPGIAPKALGRLFEPFFTTKSSGKGTGLGLSISNEISQEHGGSIAAENDATRGAWFFVRLPAMRKQP